jgi:hypothetical protein
MDTPHDVVDQELESGHENHIAHDSMVTVRLSEPPALTVDTGSPVLARGSIKHKRDLVEEAETPDIKLDAEERQTLEESPRITMLDPNGNELFSPTGSESASSDSRRGSDSSEASMEGGGVNWEELQQTEEKEPRDETSDDVSPNHRFIEFC